MKRILEGAIGVLILVGCLSAHYGFSFNNNLFLTEDPYVIPFGTFEIEPVRTVFSFGGDDSASYSSYSLFNNLRFNIRDFLDLGISAPLFIDGMEKNSLNYYSRGRGDLLLNLKFSLNVNEQFSFAVSPYLSLPFGRTRRWDLDSLKPDTLFEGGFLRDFTTTSYDYGLKLIAGWKKGDFNLNFNYGYLSAYRHQLTSSPPDYHLFALSGSYRYRMFKPFMELSFGIFSNSTFGSAPGYLAAGSVFELFPFMDASFSVGLPIVKRETISMVEPEVNSDYPGFLSSFPNYREDVVLSVGVKFKNIVYNKQATSRVIVVVRDRATQEFVGGSKVKMGSREYFLPSGVVQIPAVKAGIQHLQVEHDGYLSVDKFVELTGNTYTRIEVSLIRKTVPVIISVKNTRMEPINAAVALVSVEDSLNTVKADSSGLIRYTMERENPLSFYISAPGYIGDNFYIDPPVDRDSIRFDVVLKEEKDEVAVLPIIYFEVGSSKIRKEFFPFLDIVGRYMVDHPGYKLEIIGHASAEGSEKFNQALSLRRAEECKKHLLLRYKVEPDRIIVRGFGKDVPAVPNKTEYQRSINRRAEFKLIPPEK